MDGSGRSLYGRPPDWGVRNTYADEKEGTKQVEPDTPEYQKPVRTLPLFLRISK